MVGEANEADVTIGGVQCRGLLDTGSTISTVSCTFYRDHFQGVTLRALDDLLKIECAGGSLLPYLGYIEIEVDVPELNVQGRSTVMLVVPETSYNKGVPVLLGTNILRPLMEICRESQGQQFLQRVAKSTPWWLTFRCLGVEDRAVSRARGRLGLVKCASSAPIRIRSNTAASVAGFISDPLPCARLAMIHGTEKTVLPSGVEVTPTLTDYCHGVGLLQVEITNLSGRPIVLAPRSLLCELQQCEVVDSSQDGTTDDSCRADIGQESEATGLMHREFLEQFKIEQSLGLEEKSRLHALLLSYRDIFSTGDFDIGHTTQVKHCIDLTDEVPFKQRHRNIPPSMYEEVRAHLQQLLDQGIISEASSPWASGVVLVRKKDGRLRFCIDYRQLNQRTVRDSYDLPRIEELMDHLIGAKFFSSLDMRSGYYQVEVEDEHKPRTAFTVGPLGFYQCERMPFGLTNSPATFQRLMEKTMGELHMKECLTFIDDVIVPGRSFDEELLRLEHVFEKVRKQHLKLNPKKCDFCRRKVAYCGHVVSEFGVEADPAKRE